jgi:hypothetical protein
MGGPSGDIAQEGMPPASAFVGTNNGFVSTVATSGIEDAEISYF